MHPENISTETAIADTYNLRDAEGFWPPPDSGHVPMVDHPELVAETIRATAVRAIEPARIVGVS